MYRRHTFLFTVSSSTLYNLIYSNLWRIQSNSSFIKNPSSGRRWKLTGKDPLIFKVPKSSRKRPITKQREHAHPLYASSALDLHSLIMSYVSPSMCLWYSTRISVLGVSQHQVSYCPLRKLDWGQTPSDWSVLRLRVAVISAQSAFTFDPLFPLTPTAGLRFRHGLMVWRCHSRHCLNTPFHPLSFCLKRTMRCGHPQLTWYRTFLEHLRSIIALPWLSFVSATLVNEFYSWFPHPYKRIKFHSG